MNRMFGRVDNVYIYYYKHMISELFFLPIEGMLIILFFCSGSVHDSRILRESAMFADFERVPKITSGLILGDGGYMLTDWLMTPFVNAATDAQMRYNTAHCSTRSTIERCNGVLKRRWHCLHAELRFVHMYFRSYSTKCTHGME